MIKRRRTAVLAAFAVVASVFLLPASPASAATFDNACVEQPDPDAVQPDPDDDDRYGVAEPGGARRYGHLEQHLRSRLADSPGGLRRRLQRRRPDDRDQQHPDHQHPHGDRGHEHGRRARQTTNNATTTATTTITDPNGIPGTGDETATAGTVNVTYANQTWTAGASGTINFRENTVTPLDRRGSPPSGRRRQHQAVVAGVITVQFGCDPGHGGRVGASEHDRAHRSGRDVRQHPDPQVARRRR